MLSDMTIHDIEIFYLGHCNTLAPGSFCTILAVWGLALSYK